ncbi:MAG TPA: ParB/RepB/Spo0J family partition protein [Chloroflexota bacterium]|nr:ParB/RepB/Spo0J family partition protein [Chloroflexota bacterium]
MPARRGTLGRGLDALIGQPAEPAPGVLPGEGQPGLPTVGGTAVSGAERPTDEGRQGVTVEVELGRIERNPRQPRRHMEEEQLAELADSIREHGLLQPLVVAPLESGNGGVPRYRLIAGERRWHAARIAGLIRVPVMIRDASPRELLELALVENVQRADLNAVEQAMAYRQLAEEFGLTQEQIGQRVGKSRFAIANTLRLLHLPAVVQQSLIDGQLSEGHARALLGLADPEAQRRLAQQVIEQQLSVRQTEELVRRLQHTAAAPAPVRRPGRPVATDVLELEERFRDALGTKVSLSRSKRGGRLTIYYYDDEQLQSLYDRLTGPE